MSKFKIYRVDEADPKIIGHQSKMLVLGYSILFLLTYFTINSHLLVKELHFSKLAYYIILSILFLATLFFVFKIKRQIKNLNKIGTLEFTQTKIKKEIGDLKTEIPFDRILRIEIEKHLRALTVFQSKTGAMTYIIKIIQTDLKEDQLVVSEKSVDFGQKISLVNTFKTLQKISNLDIVINKN
jgi:hypothetical protein